METKIRVEIKGNDQTQETDTWNKENEITKLTCTKKQKQMGNSKNMKHGPGTSVT